MLSNNVRHQTNAVSKNKPLQSFFDIEEPLENDDGLQILNDYGEDDKEGEDYFIEAIENNDSS